MKKIKLKERMQARIIRGFPWVYKNEIETDLSGFKPGELVEVYNYEGMFLGIGYINPNSMITVRVLTNRKERINQEFIHRRLLEAYQLRKRFFPGEETFRWVFSESDGLPGLIVDKYESVIVIQSTTCGMDKLMSKVVASIDEIASPEVIVLKNDSPVRKIEGVNLERKVLKGDVDRELTFTLNGLRFVLDPLTGQKTGFFLDQRENYLLLQKISKDAEVLDVFCYEGGWGLHAAKFGAAKVDFLDSSEKALNMVKRNIELNGFDRGKFGFIHEDAFDMLRAIEKSGRKYDIVILDPPAFVKTSSKVREALKGYKEINLRAVRIVKPGGFLITCSCSSHVSREQFLSVVREAGMDSKKKLIMLELRGQPKDHPVLITLKESSYLKCALFRVI